MLTCILIIVVYFLVSAFTKSYVQKCVYKKLESSSGENKKNDIPLTSNPQADEHNNSLLEEEFSEGYITE